MLSAGFKAVVSGDVCSTDWSEKAAAGDFQEDTPYVGLIAIRINYGREYRHTYETDERIPRQIIHIGNHCNKTVDSSKRDICYKNPTSKRREKNQSITP